MRKIQPAIIFLGPQSTDEKSRISYKERYTKWLERPVVNLNPDRSKIGDNLRKKRAFDIESNLDQTCQFMSSKKIVTKHLEEGESICPSLDFSLFNSNIQQPDDQSICVKGNNMLGGIMEHFNIEKPYIF